jgi:hypothetical protein
VQKIPSPERLVYPQQRGELSEKLVELLLDRFSVNGNTMGRGKKTSDSESPLLLVFLSFICSFLGGLLFSILALRAKRRQKTVIWWFILSMIFISTFSYIANSFIVSSSPTKDSFFYYLGLSTLVFNGIAALVLLITLFSKNKK